MEELATVIRPTASLLTCLALFSLLKEVTDLLLEDQNILPTCTQTKTSCLYKKNKKKKTTGSNENIISVLF